MSQHELSCVIIRQNTVLQQKLELALRALQPGIECHYVDDVKALKTHLKSLPLLVFCSFVEGVEKIHAVLAIMQQLAPDCILVNVTDDSWQGLSAAKQGDVEVCALSTRHSTMLQQQLNYLLAYVRLKAQFRQCKHLLSVAELRSQWLVDYAREAVAYIARGQHLHVNIAYLSLFSFDAEPEALKTPVLKLVEQEDQSTFLRLSLEAERQVRPSNKLLINLSDRHGRSFRAEMRFIPSVYLGRRCVQLHVHPLIRSSERQNAQAGALLAKRNNPWHEQSTTTVLPPQEDVLQKSGKQLYPVFSELLNLQAAYQPALFAARPGLQYTSVLKLPYEQLLENAHNDESRFWLDYRNLRMTLNYLAERRVSPLREKIVLSVGGWLLHDVKNAARLLKTLRQSPSLSEQLVLALDVAHFKHSTEAVLKLLDLLRNTGVDLLFDRVRRVDDNLFALLEVVGSKRIRTHVAHTQHMIADDNVVIPERLQLVLQQMHEQNIAVIIDGIKDLQSLNVLCETTASHLQGPILETFSR